MDNRIHKYDIGVIGNCSYLAYIDILGIIVLMCHHRFDNQFLFSSLFDQLKGGMFPVTPFHLVSKTILQYIKNRTILCTGFTTITAIFRIAGFAPWFCQFDRYFYKRSKI